MSSSVRDLPRRHGFTRSDYYRMAEAGILGEDDRVELIEGQIIDMAPTGSRHAGTVKFLGNLLKGAVGQNAVLSVQDPVKLDEHSEPQPDLALLRPRPDYYRDAHPEPADVLLIVEVAESSLTYDRDVKLPLYAAHNIPEVWLVDLDGGQLSRHRQPGATGYQRVDRLADLAAVPLPAPPGGRVDLTGLFGERRAAERRFRQLPPRCVPSPPGKVQPGAAAAANVRRPPSDRARPRRSLRSMCHALGHIVQLARRVPR